MPESPRPDRLDQDFGLGGRMSERSRARLLNHDGTFNVRRNNLSPLHPYNVYNTLLSLPIPRLLGERGVPERIEPILAPQLAGGYPERGDPGAEVRRGQRDLRHGGILLFVQRMLEGTIEDLT